MNAIFDTANPAKRVDLDPLKLAAMAQTAIREHHAKIIAEGGLIRQLLTGRHVKHRETGVIWHVREVRVGLGGIVTLYGVSKGKRRNSCFGLLADLELHTPGAES